MEVKLSYRYTTYSIVVEAYNSRGTGPSSDYVTAQTLEDGELPILQFE